MGTQSFRFRFIDTRNIHSKKMNYITTQLTLAYVVIRKNMDIHKLNFLGNGVDEFDFAMHWMD